MHCSRKRFQGTRLFGIKRFEALSGVRIARACASRRPLAHSLWTAEAKPAEPAGRKPPFIPDIEETGGALLRRIESGQLEVVARDPPAPSTFDASTGSHRPWDLELVYAFE
jgi:hypothetical protein